MASITLDQRVSDLEATVPTLAPQPALDALVSQVNSLQAALQTPKILIGGATSLGSGTPYPATIQDPIQSVEYSPAGVGFAGDDMVIPQTGFYRIHFWTQQLGSAGLRGCRLMLGGQPIATWYQTCNDYSTATLDVTDLFYIGSHIRVECTGASNYNWFPMQTGQSGLELVRLDLA